MHDSLLHRVQSGLTTEADAQVYASLVIALARVRGRAAEAGTAEMRSALSMEEALREIYQTAHQALLALGRAPGGEI